MFARKTGATRETLEWFTGEVVTGYQDLENRGVTPDEISAALLDFVVWRISLQTSAAQCGCCKHAYGVYCSLNQDQMPVICERFTFDRQAYSKQLDRLKLTISCLNGLYGFDSQAVLEGVEDLLRERIVVASLPGRVVQVGPGLERAAPTLVGAAPKTA